MINFESQNKIRLGMARRMANGGMVVNDAQKLRNERNRRQREDRQAVEMGRRMAEMDMANAMTKQLNNLGFDPKFDKLPKSNLTPAQQIYAQSMDRKYPNVDRDNPLVKAVLDKNPMLANYIDTQYQKLNEDYGSQASIEKAENLVRMDDFEKANLQRLYDEKAMEVSPAMAEIEELDTPSSMPDTEIDQENPLPGDIVDAKLEPGEYVLNKNIVKAIGKKALDTLNKEIMPRFAKGKRKTKKELKKSAQIAKSAFAKASAKAKDKVMNLQEGGKVPLGQRILDYRMNRLAKKDPALKYYLSDEYTNQKGGGPTQVSGTTTSNFSERGGRSFDNFTEENRATYLTGPLKGSTSISRFSESVPDGDYGSSDIDDYFGLQTDVGEYNLEPKKWYSKIKMQEGGSIGTPNVDKIMKQKLKKIQQDKKFRELLKKRVPKESYQKHIKMREASGDLMTKEETEKVLQYFMQRNKAKQNYQEGGMVSSNSTGGEMKGAPMSSRRKMNTDKKFKPHMMYHPKTKKGVMANKMSDHLRLKRLGYTHSK